MLVTNANKVILHMPRCAGSSIRWALIKAGYKYRFSCEHAPIKMLPQKYKDYPRIAFIRNPIHWYHSRYYYAKKKIVGNKIGVSVLLFILSDGFKLSFDEFIVNAVNLNHFFADQYNIKKLKMRIQRVVMNTYCCWQAFKWEDVENISSADFNGTFFDYTFKTIGLDTAKIYRIEDGVQNSIDKEFKNVIIQKRNSGCGFKPISSNSQQLIENHDLKYFNMFNY
jgi:hypothetical protein